MLQDPTEPSTWRLWALYLRSQQGITPHNTIFQMFDIELHEELRQELISHNAILGGGETLSELQQLLEEIEGESAAQDHIASFYSY